MSILLMILDLFDVIWLPWWAYVIIMMLEGGAASGSS